MQLDQPLTIGNVKLRNRAMLAPMSGVSDLPFRELAWKFGAGMVVSEMVASESFVEGEAEMQMKAQSGNLPIHMVQLIGREAYWMGRGAKMIEAQGADIIDINMGCPSRKVTTPSLAIVSPKSVTVIVVLSRYRFSSDSNGWNTSGSKIGFRHRNDQTPPDHNNVSRFALRILWIVLGMMQPKRFPCQSHVILPAIGIDLRIRPSGS